MEEHGLEGTHFGAAVNCNAKCEDTDCASFTDSDSEYGYSILDDAGKHGEEDESRVDTEKVPPVLVGVKGTHAGVEHHSLVETDGNFGSDGDDDGAGVDEFEVERVGHWPVFNPACLYNPIFELGMIFVNKNLLREAIHSAAIVQKRSLKLTKNDKVRVYAKCVAPACPWAMHAIRKRGEEVYQIRFFMAEHTCNPTQHVTNIKSSWVAKKYMHKFKINPKWRMKGFRADVIDEIKVDITLNQAYRARKLALKFIQGNPQKQYEKLWDFAAEIRRSNPGSTITLEADGSDGVNRFDRMYICLDALRKGFLDGCRPIVGMDSHHLSGPHGGVLLTAVGVDPNNSQYPIAFAIVRKENAEIWAWFLRLLNMDIGINQFEHFTLMSDKQNGLIQAVSEVIPMVEHRFCVRHLHDNWEQAGFRGEALKNALWRAARATTVNDFELRMLDMKNLDENAWRWFNDKHPQQWSRSHFRCESNCDILLNNGCKAFNSHILEARDLPILSMLEWILQFLMTRLQQNRDTAIKKWKNKEICPKIQKIVNNNIHKLGGCIPIKADNTHFQVACFDNSQFAVDLDQWTCGCRRWQLSGIPCKHALSAISFQRLRVEDFISAWYSIETYSKVYQYFIWPMNGNEEWPHTGMLPMSPPLIEKLKTGEGQRARQHRIDEPRSRGSGSDDNPQASHHVRLKRQQVSIKCSNCGRPGHNKRSCKRGTTSLDDSAAVSLSASISSTS